MSNRIGNIAIYVDDLERSLAFYEGVLGLDVLARIDTPDVRETIVGRSDGGSSIALTQAKHPTPQTVARPDGFWKIYIDASDVERTFADAVAAGAPGEREPFVLEQYAVKLAFVRDPDGHLIELGQRT